MELFVKIEISKNSRIKYEYDKELEALVCDRILHTPLTYPFNYGYIPNTLSGDGDPLDAVVLMDHELIPGCFIKCKVIGALETIDDQGEDTKLILVPITKVDPLSKNIDNISDINSHTLKTIKYFYEHYKDLENKQVIVNDFLNRDKAIEVYNKTKLNNN